MALRQKLAVPGAEWSLKSELATLRALRPAREVEFRRGSDPASVVQDMLMFNHVKLCAPVGSGKSVKIPSALALATKAVVFHVVPSKQLASHLFAYLVKFSQTEGGHKQAPVELYRGDVDAVPRNGVFLLSAADMVDIMMRQSDLTRYRGCSVFLDEAHESDAYTHVVRTAVLQMGVERLVLASATFNPVVHGMRATPGSVIMKQVELGPAEEWEVDRVGSPFHMATLRDGILVFVDSRSAAKRLAVAYERAGADVFRLTSSSSEEDVAAAMRCATDKNGGLFAILVDYTYRSGFTFPVSRVVDTGIVSYYDAEPGVFRKQTRRMFEFEKEQAAGRVGRVSGDAEYFYEKGPCAAVMCDLEGVEREAAAYIYRCLGFRPSLELESAYMADHDLPVGLSVRAALQGPYPLTYYVIHVGSQVAYPVNGASEGATGDRSMAADVMQPPSYKASLDSPGTRDGSPVGRDSTKRDSGYGSVTEESVKPGGSVTEWGDMMDEFASASSKLELEDGHYYVSQVRDSKGRGVMATMTFPKGLRSVREFARGNNFEFAVRSLSREDRMWAFSALLDRYNTVTAQIRGAKSAVKQAIAVRRGSTFLERVQDVIEELSADHADAVACLRAAEVFAMSVSWVVPFDGELKAETAAYDGYMVQFSQMGKLRGGEDLDGDISTSVQDRIRQGGEQQVAKGRGKSDYSGRRYEMLMPSWLGFNKRIEYDAADTGSKRAKNMQVMQREYGHDDKYNYTITRRYTRVTTKW